LSLYEKNGVRGEIWRQNYDKFHIPSKTEDIISYTVYNCPNTEKYRVNKIHIGLGCITNLSWFCNQTSYLMFSILGQWIYHDFDIVLINFSAIFYSVNSNYLPYTVDLILNLMIWIQKQDKFIVIIWKKWSQRWNMETKLWQIPKQKIFLFIDIYGFVIIVPQLSTKKKTLTFL
jgi:hypothetical protein